MLKILVYIWRYAHCSLHACICGLYDGKHRTELVLSYIKSGSIYQFRNIYRGHIYFLWYIYSLFIFWFYRVYLVDYQN